MARKARLLGAICAVVVVLAAPLRAAGTDEATETFNALYGEDWKRVRGTRDARDDVELPARLLAAAKRASDQPFLAPLRLGVRRCCRWFAIGQRASAAASTRFPAGRG